MIQDVSNLHVFLKKVHLYMNDVWIGLTVMAMGFRNQNDDV